MQYHNSTFSHKNCKGRHSFSLWHQNTPLSNHNITILHHNPHCKITTQYYESTNFASSQCTFAIVKPLCPFDIKTHYCTPTTCKIFHCPTLISQYGITCYIKINQYSTLGITMIHCDIILHGNITKSHYEIIKLIASSQFPTMTWYALIWHHHATI